MRRKSELQVLLPLPRAVERAACALSAVGRLTEESDEELAGTIAYGMGRVRMRISCSEASAGTTRLLLEAESPGTTDRAGVSALARLEEAILYLGRSGFRADRIGLPAAAIAVRVVFAGVVVVLLYLAASQFIR